MFGTFAAEFEGDLFQVAGGRFHDLAARGGAAGESDLVHERTGRERVADGRAGTEQQLRAARAESRLGRSVRTV